MSTAIPEPPEILPPPTHANVSYGPHERNVLDFWEAKSRQRAPLVVFIHGGGFKAGDKTKIPAILPPLYKEGFALAAINYRFSTHAIYPAPMADSARAIQFLRYKAKEWNFDPERVGTTGSSAGSGISFWIAFRPDAADPQSGDPVARQSTKISCMYLRQAQCTYDPHFIRQHIPGPAWKCEAMKLLYGLEESDYESMRPEKARIIQESAGLTYVRPGLPPVYLAYENDDSKLGMDISQGVGIHHPFFGRLLKARLNAVGVECHMRTSNDQLSDPSPLEFFFKHLGVTK